MPRAQIGDDVASKQISRARQTHDLHLAMPQPFRRLRQQTNGPRDGMSQIDREQNRYQQSDAAQHLLVTLHRHRHGQKQPAVR